MAACPPLGHFSEPVAMWLVARASRPVNRVFAVKAGSPASMGKMPAPHRRGTLSAETALVAWYSGGKWSRRDSNARPSACHADALPTELRPRGNSAVRFYRPCQCERRCKARRSGTIRPANPIRVKHGANGPCGLGCIRERVAWTGGVWVACFTVSWAIAGPVLRDGACPWGRREDTGQYDIAGSFASP